MKNSSRKKLVKAFSVFMLTTYVMSFGALGDSVYFYNFDDENYAVPDATVTNAAVENDSANISGTGAKWGYIDGYNNLSLLFDTNASADAKISGVNFDFGPKFVLETKIMTKDFLSQTSASINLVKTADGSTLKWYLAQDGKLHFDVNNGTAYSFTSAASVMPDTSTGSEEQWTNLYTVVDLGQDDEADVVKMYAKREGLEGAAGTVEFNLWLPFYGIIDSATGGDAPHTLTHYNTVNDTTNYITALGSRAFNGTSAYLTAPDSADWDINADKDTNTTVDLWVKFDNAAGSQEAILAQLQATGNYWVIYRDSDGKIKFYSQGGGSTVDMALATTTVTAANTWYHVAFIRKGSTNAVGLYVNGVQEAYHLMTATNEQALAGLLMIGKQSGMPYLSGNLDELRIAPSNHFTASPVIGLTDTITVPNSEAPGNTVALIADSNWPASGGITLSPASNAVELLERSSNAFTLKTDFVKVTADASFTTFDTANFEGASETTTTYTSPDSSSAINIDATQLFRRICNPASQITGGGTGLSASPIADDGSQVFYGLFEINLGLDGTVFDGTVTVGIHIKKPEDSVFKKIGSVQVTEPESGDWTVKYYWNSRVAYTGATGTGETAWGSGDADAYRTDGPVQFKFQVE